MQQTKFALAQSPSPGTLALSGRRRLCTFLALFILISLAILTTILFTRLSFAGKEPVANPFVTYTSVLPGQPWNGNLSNGFSCYAVMMIPSPGDTAQVCTCRPQTGIFSRVTLIVWKGFIMRLEFNVRENLLTVGDLSLWWTELRFDLGRGIVSFEGNTFTAIAMAQTHAGRYTYFSPISEIIVEARADTPQVA
jgi:hypothetical protein